MTGHAAVFANRAAENDTANFTAFKGTLHSKSALEFL